MCVCVCVGLVWVQFDSFFLIPYQTKSGRFFFSIAKPIKPNHKPIFFFQFDLVRRFGLTLRFDLYTSNPVVNKSLVFRWRKVEWQAHYPPWYHPNLGISQSSKKKNWNRQINIIRKGFNRKMFMYSMSHPSS